MGDYNRTTRECAFNQFRPELLAAIQKHAQDHDLGNLSADALLCCETTSERKKGGGDKFIYTAMLVSPRWLVWATSGEKQKAVALSVQLSQAEIRDYESTPFYKMIQDSGLYVSGQPIGTPERGETFIGLGKEPAAQKFRDAVTQASQAARR